MSDITYEEILEDFIVFRTAFSKIFSIQDNLERLRDEYLPKSKHKQQLKKLVQINENQNKSLQERFKKLEEENEIYKKKTAAAENESDKLRNENVLIRKRKELMECDLNEKNSSLKIENETFRGRLDSEIEESEQRETKLRKENIALQNELEELKKRNHKLEDELGRLKQKNQSLHNNFNENQNKFNDIKTRNSELKETVDDLTEALKILENKNHGLEHAKRGLEYDKKGLELTLKQNKRQFESLSKESPEIASKICKQQGYAITSDCQSTSFVKTEPGEKVLETKHINKNFMCRDCYSDWLSKIPKSGDLTMVPNPVDEIKTFSSQSDLEAHILVDHTTGREKILKCWQDGSTYTCTEPDSKNGTCSFKSNSEDQYRMHLKVDHARIRRANIYEIYGLKSYLFHLKSFRPNLNIIPQFTPNWGPQYHTV